MKKIFLVFMSLMFIMCLVGCEGTNNNLKEQVELKGTFCMGQCQKGVCVTVDGKLYSVSPETVEEFFNKYVLKRDE